ncbi:sulfurtransferase [Verrucomicrobia bacterium LW23]|nr:sulfurtransferase [Verrucomicrobia bacterium LW23]
MIPTNTYFRVRGAFLLLMAASILLLQAAPAPDKSPLVTTDWVANNSKDKDIRLIEVSVDAGLYEKGHIPGALNISWHTDLVDNPNRDVVGKEGFEKLASRLGITPDTTVILYGDNNNWFAAWGAWVFNLYGHTNVKLLDGGRKKWEAEKRPLETTTPSVKPTQYTVKAVNEKLRAFLPDVVKTAKAKAADTALLDIRSPDEFSGKIIAPAGIQELAVRAGHVPGAVNVPWATAVAADGTFKPVDELRKIYADKGVDGSKPVIVYCRIGERSAHTWFALSQLLAYEVKQYDGSWTEYGNSVGVPINNPSGTVWTGK